MTSPPIPTVDSAALLDAQAAGAVVLDVREPEEWEAGHLEGSVHAPMYEVPAWLAARGSDGGGPVERSSVERGPVERAVIVVCRSGHRSAHATAWLREQGVDARNLDGGLLAWAVEHRPLITDDGRPGFVA